LFFFFSAVGLFFSTPPPRKNFFAVFRLFPFSVRHLFLGKAGFPGGKPLTPAPPSPEARPPPKSTPYVFLPFFPGKVGFSKFNRSFFHNAPGSFRSLCRHTPFRPLLFPMGEVLYRNFFGLNSIVLVKCAFTGFFFVFRSQTSMIPLFARAFSQGPFLFFALTIRRVSREFATLMSAPKTPFFQTCRLFISFFTQCFFDQLVFFPPKVHLFGLSLVVFFLFFPLPVKSLTGPERFVPFPPSLEGG